MSDLSDFSQNFAENLPKKIHIRRAFDRAAPHYDEVTPVQQRVCQHLFAWLVGLPPNLKIVDKAVLDAGCGTGYALSLLQTRHPASAVISLDFSFAMLKEAAKTPAGKNHAALSLCADLTHLPLTAAHFSLYWSSLALQWCDPAKSLAEAFRVLSLGGQLAVASLLPKTFHELRTAFLSIDDAPHTLSFTAADSWIELTQAAKFSHCEYETREEIVYYPDAANLLYAIKAAGANQWQGEKKPFSREKRERLLAALEKQRTPLGIPLTYAIILLRAEKI